MSDCSLFINPAIKSFWVENPIWNLDKYKYSQIDIIQTSKGEIYFTQNCRSCKYSSWWMSKILSSLKSFTISLLWQFGKRHNVCGQRILMFKYFETQYWNFPGSLAAWVLILVLGPLQAGNDVRWGQWRCGHGPTYNLHTGHTQVLAVSVLSSPVSNQGERRCVVQQQCPGHVQCVVLWDAAMHTWTRTRHRSSS